MSNSCSNPFESVLSSFDKACMYLDIKANMEIIQTKQMLEKDTESAEATISEFNQIVKDVSVASDELLQSENVLKTVTENFLEKNSIFFPQDLQAHTIDSVKDIYSLNSPFAEALEKKLINDQFKVSNDVIQKVTLRTINQVNNIKNTLLTNMKLSENN